MCNCEKLWSEGSGGRGPAPLPSARVPAALRARRWRRRLEAGGPGPRPGLPRALARVAQRCTPTSLGLPVGFSRTCPGPLGWDVHPAPAPSTGSLTREDRVPGWASGCRLGRGGGCRESSEPCIFLGKN